MKTAADQDVAIHEQRATSHRTGPTIRPARSGTAMRRTMTILATTLTLLVGFTATAQAGGPGVDREQYVEGLFYGDFDREILLFAGGTAEDFCNEDEPSHSARVFTRRDGSIVTKVNASRQPIYLYSSSLGAPELIDATCEALSDDDPSTVPLEPFAEGEGLVHLRREVAPDGTVHAVNSTVGAASSKDGATWRVRGWADLMIVDDVPVGDPADFQGLRINRTCW